MSQDALYHMGKTSPDGRLILLFATHKAILVSGRDLMKGGRGDGSPFDLALSSAETIMEGGFGGDEEEFSDDFQMKIDPLGGDSFAHLLLAVAELSGRKMKDVWEAPFFSARNYGERVYFDRAENILDQIEETVQSMRSLWRGSGISSLIETCDHVISDAVSANACLTPEPILTGALMSGAISREDIPLTRGNAGGFVITRKFLPPLFMVNAQDSAEVNPSSIMPSIGEAYRRAKENGVNVDQAAFSTGVGQVLEGLKIINESLIR